MIRDIIIDIIVSFSYWYSMKQKVEMITDFGDFVGDKVKWKIRFERKLDKPKLYDVLLLDEAGTNCRYSVTILMNVFNFDLNKAARHKKEAALTGSSVLISDRREIAETRAHFASQEIKKHQAHDPFIQLVKFDIKRAP